MWRIAAPNIDKFDVFFSSGVIGSCFLSDSKHSFRCARRFFSSLLWTSLVPALTVDGLLSVLLQNLKFKTKNQNKEFLDLTCCCLNWWFAFVLLIPKLASVEHWRLIAWEPTKVADPAATRFSQFRDHRRWRHFDWGLHCPSSTLCYCWHIHSIRHSNWGWFVTHRCCRLWCPSHWSESVELLSSWKDRLSPVAGWSVRVDVIWQQVMALVIRSWWLWRWDLFLLEKKKKKKF